LNAEELCLAIQQSEYIICRSGYSTVMELLALKKKMIVVPTPGQTEQEYLAGLLMQRNLAISVNQTDFNLDKILEIRLSNLIYD
jgi:UDP-N-acetylglucosamine:LPS N-acetylglucosamine transferase